MSKKIYNWKRFWCSRTSQVNLGDRGYLYDPESEYGHLLNPELVGLEAIADVPCLILLGEPGIGKSQEMKNLVKYTVESIQPSHPPLELNLRSCNNLATDLIKDQDFIDWSNGEHRLYLFLDSLDEGLLTIRNLATQLVDELSKNKYSDKLDRLYLRIACRTAVLPQFLEEGLQRLWAENLAVYELAPLRQVDVENAATEENIESQDFLSEVRDKALVPLAIKPLTLRFLLNIYKRNGNQFSVDQTLCSLYLEGCRLLCAENNLSRQGANQREKLEPDQRLIIAARIAAITIFANRFAIWTGSNQGESSTEDVLLEQLILGNEFSNGRSIDVTESAIREVLDTGLFSSRGSNRIGWAHQTYAEFLAAWYLKQHNVDKSKILNLITHPSRRVVPQLEETTAWLASMEPEIFQEVLITDPDVLLHSDIATADYESKSKLVESLLMLHNRNRLKLFRFWKYDNLRYPGLATQLEAHIIDSTKNQDSRYIAILIAILCQERTIQNRFVDIALDTTQLYEIRKISADAVCKIGDENTKAQLKSLALGDVGHDPDDALKGYGFQAIWPQHITTLDLLSNLSPPTTTGIVGSVYQDFIATEFTKYLELSDLPIALKWLEKLPNRHLLHYPFINLADSVMVKAWQNLDEPSVIKAVANIAILKLKRYEGILGDKPSVGFRYISEQNCDDEIEPLLKDSDDKRRKLIETIVSLITEPEENLFWLTGIVCSKDIFWIIDKATSSESDRAANIWAEILDSSLTSHNLRWKNTNHISAILEACNVSSAMKNRFIYETTPIELHSEKANQLKADYLRRESHRKQPEPTSLTTPELKQEVVSVLERIELKQPELWWQIPQAMTLVSNESHYNNYYEADLDVTIFPGWIEADIDIRSRVMKAAKTYLFLEKLDIQEYKSNNSLSLSNAQLAGCRALYLLFQQDLEFVSTIPSEVWMKWMPIIFKSIVVSNGCRNEICQKIVKAAYKAVPNKFIEILVDLITCDNNQSDTFYGDHIYEVIGKMLDECIASLVFDKIQNKDLNAKLLDKLLSDLSSHTVEEARSIALSFLTRTEEVRGKKIVAARMLTIYADDASWSTLWSVVQQDLKFGREVFEAIALRVGYQNIMQHNLNEDHLANLYIFLVQQFPESEELKSQDNRGAIFKPQESIDGIKRWRSNILQRLQSIGSVEAFEALRKMIVELPEQKGDLQQKLLAIESSIRRTTWKYPKPEEFLELILNREKRLVQNGEQLLNVLIESLDRLELELQGETPAVRDLWDKNNGNNNLFRPIDENAFSDYVKRFLDKDLKSRGIVINREVELRRGSGGKPGERTDIHVDAVIQLPNGEKYDSITVIIEVKGCWHQEVQTAMESQLVNRYLAENTCNYGLYLIGWFNCTQWDSDDSRRKKAPNNAIDEARATYNSQAEKLSLSGNVIRAYVMNTALR
jgi:predicted NACHT family NTPase